ncbi:MAG TPA: hypothetical protein VEP30_14315 [Chthoniobacterales bacterium]|nr:hypothetical protein [Chthoniobacterales bacterium]
MAIASLALMSASAADFCQQTSQDALDGCQNNAKGDRSIALGKCDNVSDPTARTDCRNQAATDFQNAMQTCQDEFNARQFACQKLGPAPYDPVINPANFVQGVNNPYFPLPPGRTLVYEGKTVDGFEHDEFIITRKTKVIQGVTCVQVRDLVYLDGVLAEDTLDWFAQDKDGNVWYFGENTGELVDGRFVTLDGTFTAGVNRDKPGIIMEAHPQIGDFYRQEFSLDNAEDFAEVITLSATVKVPAGTFKNCLQTQETTPLETDLLEQKYYSTGIGNVLTVNSRNGDKLKLVKITIN